MTEILRFLKNNWYFIFLLIPLAGMYFFWLQFGKADLSKENFSSGIDKWGQFGDYFNWIIGAFNTILLYRLTQVANNLQKKGVEKQLAFEIYKNFIFKLDELQYQFYEDFVSNKLKEADQRLKVTIDITKQGKQDFKWLNQDLKKDEFDKACDEFCKNIGQLIAEKNGKNFGLCSQSRSKIKELLLKQLRMD